jgi:hypothetical protein
MKAMYESGGITSAPNAHCYTAVINSCAYCIDDATEKKNALDIALNTYKELERTPSHGSPNHVTYAELIGALSNLLPPSDKRTRAVRSVFKRCHETGQVDGLVVRRLQMSLTAAELKETLSSCNDPIVSPDGSINVQSIPAEWKRRLRP